MNAEEWDERYRASELLWSAGPNRWVEQEVPGLRAGTALDLACGEGRNARWLAGRGWRVTAVDFSPVAIEKARTLAAGGPEVDWRCGDVTTYRPDRPADLVLMCYLQLSAGLRRRALAVAADALPSGGTLLVVGHDSSNIAHGVGGPQDPDVLFTAADVSADLAALFAEATIGEELVIEKAEAVLRPVEGADRPAIDALVRAHRPGAPVPQAGGE